MSESHIGGFHRPVQTLVDTLISFSRPPQAKKKCKQVSSLALPRNRTCEVETAQGSRPGQSRRADSPSLANTAHVWYYFPGEPLPRSFLYFNIQEKEHRYV